MRISACLTLPSAFQSMSPSRASNARLRKSRKAAEPLTAEAGRHRAKTRPTILFDHG